MALAAGARLGPYEILALAGAGGMGEVYRARDTRLDRTVAVKVLPAGFADNPELRQRFEREARAVSALNHPHICVLHDVGCHDGIDYLVMEYLDGETLVKRLARGRLPHDECLTYAAQVASALDDAHRGGVVHRDLKPGNIMITKSGVKLLDFGLAAIAQPAPSGDDADTLTEKLTRKGTIAGTLPYMAPEQLEGKNTDARTDIFAFGALLYEMATGARAFSGNSQASLIAAVLTSQPSQPVSPPVLDHLLRKCLEKDPDQRWQSARDLAWQLNWIKTAGEEKEPVAKRSGMPAWAWVAVCVFVAFLAAAGARMLRAPAARTVGSFTILPPEGHKFLDSALSPDGTRLAFTALAATGKQQLWVRRMDATQARILAGTEGARYPFWSPDSRNLGFFAAGYLKRIGTDPDSGPAQTLAEARVGRGGAWNRDGVIVFAPNMEDGLYRVPAGGGPTVAVTALNRANRENAHRWPQFLPDGKTFLFLARSSNVEKQGVYAATLEAPQPNLLMVTPYAAAYAPLEDGSTGYLLSMQGETLLARPFDPKRLAFLGEPASIAEPIGALDNRPYFSVADDTAITYKIAEGADRALAWVDRSGAITKAALPTRAFSGSLRLSADERYAAVYEVDAKTAVGNIWIVDLERGTPQRITSGPAYDWVPIWSPDGTRIAFASNRAGPMDLYEKPLNGLGGEKLLLKSAERKIPSDWTKDGRFLIYQQEARNAKWDLWALPLGSDRKPVPLLQSDFNEQQGAVSPDGKWLAYCSDETGSEEVYVQAFAPASRNETTGKVRISLQGGSLPQWRRDGREIFYTSSGSRLTAVPIESSAGSFKPGAPRELFSLATMPGPGGQAHYGPSRDGSRFLAFVANQTGPSTPLTIVLNWAARLKR